MSLYTCMACQSEGKEVQIPADEVGAALMQQHLKTEHGIAFASEFRRCRECDQSILVVLGAPPTTSCREHS